MIQDIFSDSISYAQFKLAMTSLEVETYSILQDPAFKPAIVLGAAALVNTLIFMNYKGDNKQLLVHQTTAIFVVGGLLSVITYFVQ